MTIMEESQVANLEICVATALKKIGSQKEKDICKFLPSDTEGHMHHFTLKKMRKSNPQQFRALIEEFIINQDAPRQIEPRRRVRKNKSLSLNQIDLRKILELAQKTGDKYLLSKLGSKISLSHIKRELIKSIRKNTLNQELWQSYVQAIEARNSAEQ